MDRKARIEARLRRRSGMSAEALARLRMADDAAVWHGHCRHCGTSVSGSRADLLSRPCPVCHSDVRGYGTHEGLP